MPDALRVAILWPMLKKSDDNFEQFQNFRPISNLKVAIQLTDHEMSHHLDETFQCAYKNFHSTEWHFVCYWQQWVYYIFFIEFVSCLRHGGSVDTVVKIAWPLLGKRYCTCMVWVLPDVAEAICTGQWLWINTALSRTWCTPWICSGSSSLSPLYIIHCWYHQAPQVTVLFIRWWHPAVYILKTECSYDLALAKRRVECCVNNNDYWMVNNGLKLNQDKTELVPISSKFRSSPSLDFIQADDENVENIQPKSSARDLGLPGRLNQSC